MTNNLTFNVTTKWRFRNVNSVLLCDTISSQWDGRATRTLSVVTVDGYANNNLLSAVVIFKQNSCSEKFIQTLPLLLNFSVGGDLQILAFWIVTPWVF